MLVGKRHRRRGVHARQVRVPRRPACEHRPMPMRVAGAAPIADTTLRCQSAEGRPRTTAGPRPRLAVAAIREACEETGLCLGRSRRAPQAGLIGLGRPFAQAGLLPGPVDAASIARAITPPGRTAAGYDTRFFAADASAIAAPRRRRGRMPMPSWSNWSGSRSVRAARRHDHADDHLDGAERP
ncbi:MAG: hypothetical protein MZV49_23840 [Rhodopseudomonas palustris]|nr:hypothetical protein [Rhodopseudomonas palustris]